MQKGRGTVGPRKRVTYKTALFCDASDVCLRLVCVTWLGEKDVRNEEEPISCTNTQGSERDERNLATFIEKSNNSLVYSPPLKIIFIQKYATNFLEKNITRANFRILSFVIVVKHTW